MRFSRVALIFLALFCAARLHAAEGHVHSGPPPVKLGVGGFDVYRDGKVLHLLSAEFDEARKARQLLYGRSNDEGRTWTQPVRVNADDTSLFEIVRGNDPQIAAHGDSVIAVWTAKGSGYGGSGPLMTAISRDGGISWKPGGNPADTSSTAGHAYSDVIAGPGGFDVVWLDGRDGAQGLRHAHSRDGIRWSRNTTIQKATCECCWNSLERAGEDLLVMVRGKEPRDMLLFTRNRDDRWIRTATVGAFGWNFKGCPHTGGGLVSAANGAGPLHAVVWTGAAGSQGVHYLKSVDRGKGWSSPHRVGSTDARRADIAVHAAGAVLVAWDQFEPGAGGQSPHGGIYVMESRDAGVRWWKPTRLTKPGTDASYPRVVPTAEGFLVLWTEAVAGAGTALRMQAVRSSR